MWCSLTTGMYHCNVHVPIHLADTFYHIHSLGTNNIKANRNLTRGHSLLQLIPGVVLFRVVSGGRCVPIKLTFHLCPPLEPDNLLEDLAGTGATSVSLCKGGVAQEEGCEVSFGATLCIVCGLPVGFWWQLQDSVVVGVSSRVLALAATQTQA